MDIESRLDKILKYSGLAGDCWEIAKDLKKSFGKGAKIIDIEGGAHACVKYKGKFYDQYGEHKTIKDVMKNIDKN